MRASASFNLGTGCSFPGRLTDRRVGVLLLVGTRKGLFLIRGGANRSSWELEGPLLTGWSVFHAMQDLRDGKLYVAGNNFVYGGTVQRSSDVGQTWERSEGLGLPEETGLQARGGLARRARARERAGDPLPRRDARRALP